MIHYLITILLVLTGISRFADASDKEEIRKIIDNIPINDQECLEYFFRYMVTYQNFGYVLFGKKPMVWVPLNMKIINFNKDKSKSLEYNRLLKCYNTWLQYRHLFPMENYIFRSYQHEDNFSHHMIIFMNRKKTVEIIQDNIELFKKKLNNSITPEKILYDLETKDNIIEEVFHGNHDLLGIILGFGVHNSIKFQERYSLFRFKHPPPPYDNRIARKVQELIVRILEKFYFNLTGFPHVNNKLFFIDLPYFVVDSKHPESIQIQETFFADQKIIGGIYTQGKFLERTLEALTRKDD